MHNPFKYGELVSGQQFCNRTAELKRLQQAFKDGQNVVLISPRRWGKSSLVNRALEPYEGEMLVVKLDCFGIRSSEKFFASLLHAFLTASSTKFQQLSATVGSFLKKFTPYIKYSIGDNDEVRISIDLPKEPVDIATILDLPQRIAEARKMRFVVCIDEFQKISEWPDGNEVLEQLRSHWQQHQEVSYCLYGSKRHIMSSMFGNASQPFYRFGETLFLPKIHKSDWVPYIVDQFKKSGKKISNELADSIVESTDSHSYFVQYLARLCWNNTEQELSREQFEVSYREFLLDNEAIFKQVTQRLTKYQINYLHAYIKGERKFTSQRVLTKYDLGSPGNIRRIETALEEAEILDYASKEPVFCDPYFKPLFTKFFLGHFS